MRKVLIPLVLASLSVFFTARADTIPGPPPKQKILFLENVYTNQADLSEGVIQNLASSLTIIKTDSLKTDTIPTRLSDFHQVWDMRFVQDAASSDSCQSTLTGKQQEQLRRYLADSGTVFLMGDNSGFPGRDNGLLAFVNSVIKTGPFGSSGTYTLNGSGCCAQLDRDACVLADNFEFDFMDLTAAETSLWTEFPGGVRLSQVGSGIPVFQTTGYPDSSWEGTPIDEHVAVGVAFPHASLKPPYSNGKLFVFFDWQALAIEDRGDPPLVRKFVANAYDFLTNITMPKAILIARPGDTTYNKATLTVTLTTDPGNVIFYTTDPAVSPTDTSNPAVRKISGSTGTVVISGTVTLKAYAIGSGYIPATGQWHYTQDLQIARLDANPGDTTYRSSSLTVTLHTNAGNVIYYTTDPSVNPGDTTNPAVLKINDSTGTVTISGTVTLKAQAAGPDYLPKDSSWTYTCKIPQLIRLELTPDSGRISAGDSLPFTARIVDDTGGIRTEFNADIAWTLTPTGSRSSLRGASGGSNTFYGIDAYKTYTIKARFTDPANASKILTDSARVMVIPGKDYRTVIEADTIVDLNAATPLDSVFIGPSAIADTVYAVVRDRFGNFCRLATHAQWSSLNTAIASTKAAGQNYAGIITRVGTGSTDVVATESSPAALQPDSVRVIIAAGQITALRLVNAATGQVIDSIVMKTGQEITLRLQGCYSFAPSTWVELAGSWSLNPNTLSLSEPLPTGSVPSWMLSPSSAGSTRLTASADKQSVTVPVTVRPVIRILGSAVCDNPFTPGSSIIPPSQRKDGDPTTGTRIEVRFSTSVVDNTGKPLMSGIITIYDAVGNCIIQHEPLHADDDKLYAIWDGRNRHRAWVAGGSYLGKIEIIDNIDKTATVLKTLIGVKGHGPVEVKK
jgi:hypothetical protein